ncbi:MAG: hypothetical protein V2I67_12885 [Thermoanaerobaculales bacterium]|jgi:hypothetical protein|nr:hypothetical protein [Thermoanaerobaculales bacterium]
MGSHTASGTRTLAVVAVVLAPLAVVLTSYGWYSALNSVIPLGLGILWTSIITLAAWGAGEPLVGRLLPHLTDPGERAYFALVGGLAVLMATTALLAVVHLLRPPTVLVALGLWACFGALRLHRSPPEALSAHAIRIDPFVVIAVAAGGLSFAAATTFAPFYDQWHYHLAFPDQWLRHGTILTFERHAYSFLPSNMGLLYVDALAGPGGWAAQIIHWLTGALTAWGSVLLSRRLGADRAGGALAAAVFLATPAVIQMGALAGSDLGVALFTVAAALALARVADDQVFSAKRALVIGGLTGLAVGCKYLALATTAIPVVAVAAALALRVPGPQRFRRAGATVLLIGAGAAVTAGPWLLRNAIVAGNPTEPYFSSVFEPSADVEDVTEGVGAFGLGAEKIGAALTLGTFTPRGHSGNIGPVHLALIPLTLVWLWRHRRRPAVIATAALIAGGVLLWALGPPLGRYLLPTLALLAAGAGAAWTQVVGALDRRFRTGCAIALAAVLAANCNPVRTEYLPDQLRCFAGAADTEAVLAANCTQLPAVRAANATLPADAVVLMVGEPRVFGLERDFVVEDSFRTPLLVELAERSASAEELAAHLADHGVTHLLVNHAEARRIATAEGREHYLECSGPDAQRILARFLAEYTRPVADGEWWEVAALIGAG